MLPGAPTPTPRRFDSSSPPASSASRTVSASSATTASGPPRAGVLRRAAPSTRAARPVMTAWIFVPPRSIPARTSGPDAATLTRASGRPRRGACGSPGRSIRRPCAACGSRGRSGMPKESTIATSSSAPADAAACAADWSTTPFGHDATPSFHAASSIALRRTTGVEAGRPAAFDEDRDDEPRARGRSRDGHRSRERLDTRSGSSGRRTSTAAVARRAREPAGVEDAPDDVLRQRGSGSVRRSSRRLAIARNVSTRGSLRQTTSTRRSSRLPRAARPHPG